MAGKQFSRRDFVRTSAAAAAGAAAGMAASNLSAADKKKILNYNDKMEYRPWGKTGLMVSAVCLGGHWKRLDKVVPSCNKGGRGWLSFDLDDPGFQKNRRDVVSKCIECGINYVDACTTQECRAYAKALEGRRDKMYFGFSWYQEEMRSLSNQWKKAKKAGNPMPAGWITEKLLQALDKGLKTTGLEYVDLWRITMHEQSDKHEEAEVEEMMKALETAKKQGKARFTGFSSHHRNHIKWMIETYPEIVDSIVTPYTAKTKEMPGESLFKTLAEYKVGFFGIKPFSSNRLFEGDSTPGSEHAERDNLKARLAIRYILCNPVITGPIPGLITPEQVENVAKAVAERRQLDVAEAKELEEAMDEAWTKLGPDYEWLKDWEYV
jgi:aryl-alcohol dehydrogenase-like predicted oxidoreductase